MNSLCRHVLYMTASQSCMLLIILLCNHTRVNNPSIFAVHPHDFSRFFLALIFQDWGY